MKDYSYELLDLLEKYKGDAEAALRGETSPWCLYAFSPLRENLFEWLEIGKKDRVLQVGSDYGSCTGLFAERAGEVVVLDPLDENLEVNRKRHGRKISAWSAANFQRREQSLLDGKSTREKSVRQKNWMLSIRMASTM